MLSYDRSVSKSCSLRYSNGQLCYSLCVRELKWVLRYRVTKFAKFTLVKGRTFASPVAHPYPNYMGVPPGHCS